ncbi:MAG: type II secretion system F family protein [Candidatus Diapherotrites archaeon]|nr:type II secretion system F family protein [Candidatus Diapherotrites archaeon]
MLIDLKYYGKWFFISIVLFLAAYLVLQNTSFSLVPFTLLFIPPMYAFYTKTKIVKEIEENFRVFLDDLKDLLQGGVNISDALAITARNDYGALTIYVKRLAAKVRLGVPMEKAMLITFGRINSPLIKKTTVAINQTLRAGGNFMKVFSVAIDYVDKVEKLKSQRKSRTTSALINSYLMFYVFVIIIILIYVFFIPMLKEQVGVNIGQVLEGGIDITGQPIESRSTAKEVDYQEHFTRLIIIQALFAGPMIGKIAEDSFVSGLKHSIILLITSLFIYITAISFLAPA